MLDTRTKTSPVVGQPTQESATFSVVEESICITRERQATSVVRVSKTTKPGQCTVSIPLKTETASIERIEKNTFIEEEYPAFQQGDTWVIPVFEYVPVTYSQLVLKEEIHVKRAVSERNTEIDLETQTQHVVVKRRDISDSEWKIVEDITAPAKITDLP